MAVAGGIFAFEARLGAGRRFVKQLEVRAHKAAITLQVARSKRTWRVVAHGPHDALCGFLAGAVSAMAAQGVEEVPVAVGC